MKQHKSNIKIKHLSNIILLCVILFQNCRVSVEPEGSLLDQRTPQGFFITSALFEILKKGPTRNWTGFSTAFASTNASDTISFDRLNQTIYALLVNNISVTSKIYSSTNGMNYSQLGVTINNTNTNIFSAFNARIQLSNYNTLDSGVSWNANTLVPGFCMVKDSGTSAFVLGNGFVDRTIDSGNSFSQITASPAYTPRTSGVCSYANGKIYLIGGQNSNTIVNDLWESSDGINWTQVSAAVRPDATSNFSRPCDFLNSVRILGFAYSDDTENKFHVVFNNLALLQSKDGKSWQCTNPSVNYFYAGGNSSITNNAILIGKRLFVYGLTNSGTSNVYTDLE